MRILALCTNLFWLWTILGVVWAWFQPEAFTWFLTGVVPGTSIKLLTAGLGIIMLGMGVTLSFADFKAVLKTPKQVFIGVAAQFLIMPFIGWSVATLFDLAPMLKMGVILVSCCPGGTASNVICYLARANVALSVLMTMCSTFLAVVLTPYLTKFYASAILEVDASAMIWSMVTIVLLPVVGGVLLNHFFKGKLEKLKAVSPVISVLVIVLIVGGVIGLKKRFNHRVCSQLATCRIYCAHLGVCSGIRCGEVIEARGTKLPNGVHRGRNAELWIRFQISCRSLFRIGDDSLRNFSPLPLYDRQSARCLLADAADIQRVMKRSWMFSGKKIR